MLYSVYVCLYLRLFLCFVAGGGCLRDRLASLDPIPRSAPDTSLYAEGGIGPGGTSRQRGESVSLLTALPNTKSDSE